MKLSIAKNLNGGKRALDKKHMNKRMLVLFTALSCILLFMNAPAALAVDVDPTDYDYGSVLVNSSATHTFRVTNPAGGGDFTGTAALVGANPAEFSIVGSSSIILGEGEFQDIDVNFNPTSVGLKEATLSVNGASATLSGTGIAPEIDVDVASIVYPDVLVGQASGSVSITVSNVGDADLELSAISLVGANPGDFSIDSGGIGSPITLVPGATHVVQVSFRPTSTGNKTAALRISNNDTDEDPFDVQLTGNGVAPDIAVVPTSRDFGDLVANSGSLTQTITITNVATGPTAAPLNVSFSAPGCSLDFTWVASGSSPIPPGGAPITVDFTYTPTDIGADTCTLVIASDDPDENPINVRLTGFGVSPANTLPTTDLELSGGVGYRDFAFGSQVYEEPTAEKPQSKLWWNDGKWWGALWNPALQRYRIHRYEDSIQQWINSGPDIDNRPLTLADACWTGTKLYIVSHKRSGANDEAEFLRYSYDGNSYIQEIAVPIPDTQQNEAMTLAQDSTGQLWITWENGNQIWVKTSTDDGVNWGPTFVLPFAEAQNVTGQDISAIVAFGGDKIGIMWSNHADGNLYFAVHNDADPDTTWNLDSGDLIAGGLAPNNHLNLKAFEGNVYAAIKTAFPGAGQPQILVLKRDSGGNWSQSVFGLDEDGHTRPILLINEEDRTLYVFAQSDGGPGSGIIYMKASGLDTIAFPAGWGTRFIDSLAADDINNPTSTKQNINRTTGLFVLAGDSGLKYYYHNQIPGAELPMPDIAVDPASGDFGGLPIGDTDTLTFTVSNAGTSDLVVTETILSSPFGQFTIVGGSAPFSVAPRDTHDIDVEFSPLSGGLKNATLSLISNDPDETPFDVPLMGTGLAPAIGAAPSPHHFGNILLGNSVFQDFVISNTGVAELDVSAVTIVGADAGEFSIVSGGGPFTLAAPPGTPSTQTVRVSFNPAAPKGPKSAALRLLSNDPVNSPLDVALTGNGGVVGDIDGDDLLDDWEIANFGNLGQNGTGDPDGDGLTNEQEETLGSNPANARPAAPTLDNPVADANDVSLTPQLTTLAFSDPENNGHAETQWQVSTEDSFTDPAQMVLDLNSDTALVMLDVPDLSLEVDQDYFWRVRFRDSAGQWSAWSADRLFTTIADCPAGASGLYCLPDDQQVDCADVVDEGEVVPPNTICIDTGDGEFIGIQGSNNVAGFDAFKYIDPADVPGNPGVDMIGLISFKAEVIDPNQPAVFIIHFDEPAPEGARVYKWNGFEWRELVAPVAVLSPDRESVTLTLEDGGDFDLDGVRNGFIIDPVGGGVPAAGGGGGPAPAGGGGGGGGCFIATSADGASLPLKIMGLILLLGSVIMASGGFRSNR